MNIVERAVLYVGVSYIQQAALTSPDAMPFPFRLLCLCLAHQFMHVHHLVDGSRGAGELFAPGAVKKPIAPPTFRTVIELHIATHGRKRVGKKFPI